MTAFFDHLCRADRMVAEAPQGAPSDDATVADTGAPAAERHDHRGIERVAGLGGGGRARVGEVAAVILLPRAMRVCFAAQPANLRQSFEGLTNQIRHALGSDPLSGHVFVFLNRRKNQVKLIFWTRGGFTIVHKRLERGTFTFPTRVMEDAVRLDALR